MPSKTPFAHRLGAAALFAALSWAGAGAAQTQEPAAVRAATDAYARQAKGDIVGATIAARLAVAGAPENLDYRLLLADLLLRGKEAREAYSVLEPIRNMPDYRVQSRRAEAASAAGLQAEAVEAYRVAAPLAPDAESRAYMTRARLMGLIALGRMPDARAGFDAAWSSGVLPGPAPLDAAMLAISVGRDDAAQTAFTAQEKLKPLSGFTALDAGYSARRLGRDAAAVRFFKQGLETMPKGADFPAQKRFEIRREVETLQRQAGFTASVSRGVASTAAGVSPSAETVTQAGADAYYRLGGYNNGRPIDAFARVFGNLDSNRGAPTGWDTAQGWVGVRWKPLSQTNLVLEASRMIALGKLARDDWMLRAAWSAESGGDLRFDRDSWTSWRLYADAAHIVDDNQTLGVADARIGRTWRITDVDLITPGVGVRGYYDSALSRETAFGAGPRLGWRHWFRETPTSAPASYLDFSLGYDVDLSGGSRARGLSATFSLTY